MIYFGRRRVPNRARTLSSTPPLRRCSFPYKRQPCLAPPLSRLSFSSTIFQPVTRSSAHSLTRLHSLFAMVALNVKLLLAVVTAVSVLAAPAPCDDHSYSESPTPTPTWSQSNRSHWHTKTNWSGKTVTDTVTDTRTVTSTSTSIRITTGTPTWTSSSHWSSSSSSYSAPAWTSSTTAFSSATPAATSPASSSGSGSGSCNAGPVQCCNSVQDASTLSPSQHTAMQNSFDQSTLSQHGLLGSLPIENNNVPVGLTCTPISVIGAGGTSW